MPAPDEEFHGEDRRSGKSRRSRISLMQVFRDQRDHQAEGPKASSSDEREMTPFAKETREGIAESTLKQHLQQDLQSLMSTIRLDAAQPLPDAPYLEKSVLNYGFRDLSSVSAAELNTPAIVQSIKNTLVNHEPRLIPESIEITLDEVSGDSKQRLSFTINAEMYGDPADIPMDFVAEVDLGAGRMKMAQSGS